MSILQFTDGVEIDTDGEYRTLQLDDGWYVVGHGTLQPCANHMEAIFVRTSLSAKRGHLLVRSILMYTCN